MRGQILAIIGDARELVAFDVIQRVGERHVAVRMVMAVGFAIGGDVHELGPGTAVVEAAEQAMGKTLTIQQQLLEGDRARDGAIVEEQGQ